MLHLLLFCGLVSLSCCRDVIYFIQAEEIDWDYAPSGRDIINHDQTNANFYLGNEGGGHIYRKVVYREYTDTTFTVKSPRSEQLGILGPTLQATTGDVITVYFRNSASHPHSIHPTRLLYTKENEGSLYKDGSGPLQKQDDAVLPGHVFIYQWNVTALDDLPLEEELCVSALYYSDTNMIRDVNSGLVGILIICQPGVNFNDEQQQLTLLFQTFDENLSWYAAETNSSTEEDRERNRMHSINGFIFGNLPSPRLCLLDDVITHMSSLGSGSDPHTVRIHGHSVIHMGKRLYSIPIYPGANVDSKFEPVEQGRWLITSQNQNLMKSGMQAMLTIDTCGNDVRDIRANGVVRKFFIAIENVTLPHRSGSKPHIGFVQYNDDTFTTKIERTPDHGYLGILGPMITAEIGDTIQVLLKNKDNSPHSIFPQGVRSHKRNEGAFYNDTTGSSPVRPGSLKTYFWIVSDFHGPTAYDLPCIPGYYISGVDITMEIHAGLIGPMLICQSGILDENARKLTGNRDFFLYYIKGEDNMMNNVQGVNGLTKDEFPRIDLSLGEKIRLHVMNIGSNQHSSSLLVDGNPIVIDGCTSFSAGLENGLLKSFEITGNREGQWEIQNSAQPDLSITYRVGSGVEAVLPTPTDTYRTFYIKISEIDVDYVSQKLSDEDWKSFDESDFRTGRNYRKARYECYMSEGYFWPCDSGLDIDVIVGKSIKIVIWNSATIPYSIYSPGVIIHREDGKKTLSLDPEERAEFIWTFQTSVGPGSGDHDCVMRRFYSNVNPEKDIASGLIGLLKVCRDQASEDADIETKPLFVGIVDENKSWYSDENMLPGVITTNLTDQSVIRYNRISTVNFFAAGSVAAYKKYINQDLSFYIHNIGDTFHVIQFHGLIITRSSDLNLLGTNVVPIFPGETKHVIFTTGAVGHWKYEGMSNEDKNKRLYGLIITEMPVSTVS